MKEKRISVRIERKEYEAATRAAQRERRTLAQWIRIVVAKAIKKGVAA